MRNRRKALLGTLLLLMLLLWRLAPRDHERDDRDSPDQGPTFTPHRRPVQP